MNVGWINLSSPNSSKNAFITSPLLIPGVISIPFSLATAKASSSVSIVSKSTPEYSLTHSIIVILFHGGLKSISVPWKLTTVLPVATSAI